LGHDLDLPGSRDVIEKIQNNQEDIEALQRDLLTLESRSEQWLLSFNTEKCKVMKLGAVDM